MWYNMFVLQRQVFRQRINYFSVPPSNILFSSNANPAPTNVDGEDANNRSLLYKKTKRHRFSAISPPLTPEQRKETKTITGIEITPHFVSWAVLDSVKQEIVGVGSHELIPESELNFCPSKMMELAFRTKQTLPISDLYVMEQKNWLRSPGLSGPICSGLSNYQAMLLPLVNDNFTFDTPLHKAFLLNSIVLIKLFQLYVGGERVSSQHIIWKMMKNSPIGYVVPNFRNMGPQQAGDPDENLIQLNWYSPDVIKSIWTQEDMWRENISNAILTVSAFNSLCIRGDSRVVNAVWTSRKKKHET